MPMAYWPSPTKREKPILSNLCGGINKSVESIEIKDNECVSVVNMDSSLFPTLTTRDGYTLYKALTGYINRIFFWQGIMYAGTDKGLYKLVSGSWVAVYEYGGTDANRLWDYAIFVDNLYFVNGSLSLQKYTGSSLSSIGTAPTNSNYIAVHANRLYLANDDDNYLSFSALRLGDDWTDTDKYVGSGKIPAETSDGEKPTGLADFSSHVVLLKKYTQHKLFGEDPSNFSMENPAKVGCISHRTIVTTEKAMYWLGVDGVHEYLGGGYPDKISDPVKSYITSINMAYAKHCCAGYDGQFLYLTLVTGASTVPNITLKFDTLTRTWWVEGYVATAYYNDGQSFYMAIGANIFKKGGTTDNGTAITYSIEMKPFSDGDETAKKTLHRIIPVADIELGSTMNVYYSNDPEGNTWTLARSITPTGTLQEYKIPIVPTKRSTWHRIKIEGYGKVKVHRIIREVKERG